MFRIFAATVLVATLAVAGSIAPAVADTTPTPSLTYGQAVNELLLQSNNLDDLFKRIASIPTCVQGQTCSEDNSPAALQSLVTEGCQKVQAARANVETFDNVAPEVTELGTTIGNDCAQFDQFVAQDGAPDVKASVWQEHGATLHEDLAAALAKVTSTSGTATPSSGGTPAPPATGSGTSNAESPVPPAALGLGALALVLVPAMSFYGWRRRR